MVGVPWTNPVASALHLVVTVPVVYVILSRVPVESTVFYPFLQTSDLEYTGFCQSIMVGEGWQYVFAPTLDGKRKSNGNTWKGIEQCGPSCNHTLHILLSVSFFLSFSPCPLYVWDGREGWWLPFNIKFILLHANRPRYYGKLQGYEPCGEWMNSSAHIFF